MVEWASLLAVSVWAYGKGGASAVGLVGLLRMLPAAVALPFGAAVADVIPGTRFWSSSTWRRRCSLPGSRP